MSNRLVTTETTGSSVASISSLPDKPQDVLIDSRATNHVTLLRHLFVSFTPTDTHLCVASEERLPVIGKGTIILPTSAGPLRLSRVLFCPNVRGTVISVGFFDRWDGSVSFSHGFTLRQDSFFFSPLIVSITVGSFLFSCHLLLFLHAFLLSYLFLQSLPSCGIPGLDILLFAPSTVLLIMVVFLVCL
jgi:hypothetical protein